MRRGTNSKAGLWSNKEAATLLDRPPSRAQVLDPASVTAVKTIAERSGSSAEAIAAMLSLDVEAVKATLASLSLDERTRNMIHTVAARSGLSAEAIATSMQLDVVAVQATLAGPAPPQSDVDAVTEPEPVKATAGNDNVDERRRRIHAAAAARAAATLARLSPQPPLPTKSDSDLARELQRRCHHGVQPVAAQSVHCRAGGERPRAAEHRAQPERHA